MLRVGEPQRGCVVLGAGRVREERGAERGRGDGGAECGSKHSLFLKEGEKK